MLCKFSFYVKLLICIIFILKNCFVNGSINFLVVGIMNMNIVFNEKVNIYGM